MITSQEWRLIEQRIRDMAAVILSGQTAATQVDDVVGTESIDNLYPGAPTVTGRPVAHPYGLVSRAPKGTVQVTARQGEHPANRLVLLHRDINRPTLTAEGEVMLYDGFGNRLYMQDGKVVVKLDGTMELGEGATKEVARKTDQITIPSGTVISGSATGVVQGSSPAFQLTINTDIVGTITQGSSKIKAVD